MVFEVSDDVIPLKRPHFGLRGSRLHFLISEESHASLDPQDITLWSLIDGTTDVRTLEGTIPDAGARIARLWSQGVCELLPPGHPAGRRPVLVVEPHMDDAILSVGGSMWKRRRACEFTVVTLAGRSNFTSYYQLDRDYFDVEQVSKLRREESRLTMRLLGGHHFALDLPEAPLRYRPGAWTIDWYRRHRKLVDAYVMHAGSAYEVEAWAAEIARLLAATEAAEVWLPLGVGAHVDHELTRDAWQSALRQSPWSGDGPVLRLYQEVPYANQLPGHSAAIVAAMGEAGWKLEPHHEDVTDAFEAKLRLVSIFGSQFKMSYMGPIVEEAAARGSPTGEGRFELLWSVESSGGPPDPLRMYSGFERVHGLVPALATWYRRHRAARRIRIMSSEPMPRWEEDLGVLAAAFPGATLEVHVGSASVPEPRETSGVVQVHPVAGGRDEWLSRLSRVVVGDGSPLILLSGEDLARWAPLARILFFRSDPFIAWRMNDLVMALRALLRDAGGSARPTLDPPCCGGG